MADVTQPSTRRARADEHTKRCYWDLHECRWVCDHRAEPAAPEERSTHPDDGQ